VEVKLIVRGICCLRPGVKGVSENIEVRSIVGRFLEHNRVYAFANAGEWEVYCASADLMDRNMFRRVETCFPVESKKLHDRILHDLNYYLNDNQQAWILQSDGNYQPLEPGESEERFQVQAQLLKEIGG
jgi:polyphosphate kinase